MPRGLPVERRALCVFRSHAGLVGVLLADVLVGEVAALVDLLVGLAPCLLVGKLRRLVQRLVAALLTLLAAEGVLRLVGEASEVHARLLPGRGVMTGGVPGRSSDDSKKVRLREGAWPCGSSRDRRCRGCPCANSAARKRPCRQVSACAPHHRWRNVPAELAWPG